MILVSGATGFVGSALVRQLVQEGKVGIRVAVRRGNNEDRGAVQVYETGDLLPDTNWSSALKGVEVVVHAAARVHVMTETSHDPLAEFRKTNVDGTLSFARQAAAMGVRRFVFISSVKVNGEVTALDRPFSAGDVPDPRDPYGVSKMEAEIGLHEIASTTNMAVTCIRPPLVYGPGVRANFKRLLSLVDRGIPLPFGAIKNARSLVSVWNLCDLINKVIEASSLQSGVLMVSDGVDLSTPSLIRRMGIAMHRSPRLVPVPVGLIKLAGMVTRRDAEVKRLCGSLTVDISETKRQLNWIPPISVDEGLARTARWYLEEVSARVV